MNSINLLISEDVKYVDSGFLTGKYVSTEQNNCHKEHFIIVDNKIQECDINNSDIIGEISKNSLSRENEHTLWLTIQTKPSFCITNIILNGDFIDLNNINLIFYDSKEIEFSYLLGKSEEIWSSEGINYFIKRVKEKGKVSSNLKISVYYKYGMKIFNGIYFLNEMFILFLNYITTFLVNRLDIRSYSINQLQHRLVQFKQFGDSVFKEEDLVAKRIAGAVCFDVILALCSFYFLFNLTSVTEIHSSFEKSTEVVASNVRVLLHWLKGAPAGLKLNEPLAESLAAFFLYHVSLWTLYLKFVSPVLAVIARSFLFIGLLGLSLQISLAIDLIKLFVLHIHGCYIYAARIHMLQMSLLSSQWRGFCGRKWNPLKKRVDSALEARGRLLTTVLCGVVFTLVLFLMPTTVVYYAVFVTLRLCVLLTQGFVSLLLWILNSNPIAIAYLQLSKSALLKGKLHFEICESSADPDCGPLPLRLQLRPSSLTDSIEASHCPQVFSPMPKPNITRICSSLIYAQELI